MRVLLGCSLLLLACDSAAPPPPAEPASVAAAAPAPLEWSPYTSVDGGFRVDLPGKPKQSVEKFGEIDYHDASVELASREVSVSVTWSDLPAAQVEIGETEAMLDAAVTGMIKRVAGKLEGEVKSIDIEHHPGREFQIGADLRGKPAHIHVRLYVVHDRLLRIVLRTGTADAFKAESEKLLASFALTPEFSAAHAEVVKFDWKPWKAPDGSFTAKFPVATPRLVVDESSDLEVSTVTGSADRSYAVFLVGWFDQPADTPNSEPEELFASLRDSAAAATNSKVVGTPEPAPLGKIPGERFNLESEGGLMKVEGRLYLVGKRLYFLQARRPHNSSVAQAELDVFFAGFSPGKKK